MVWCGHANHQWPLGLDMQCRQAIWVQSGRNFFVLLKWVLYFVCGSRSNIIFFKGGFYIYKFTSMQEISTCNTDKILVILTKCTFYNFIQLTRHWKSKTSFKLFIKFGLGVFCMALLLICLLNNYNRYKYVDLLLSTCK
jgi:hypothetical protein